MQRQLPEYHISTIVHTASVPQCLAGSVKEGDLATH